MTLDFALGTMNVGTRTTEEDARRLLDRFVDAGGTMIDTADCYAFWGSDTGFGGQSEALLGRWLADRPGLADRLFLGTKVGAEPTEVGGFPERRQGLSARAIAEGIEGSLKRLGVDRVQLYWAHMEDRSVDVAETVDALARLVEDGTVERLGASNHPSWVVERARRIAAADGRPAYTAIQNSYSLLQPRPLAPIGGKVHRFGPLTDEMIDHAQVTGLGVWAYSPLLEGAYARPERMFEAYDHPGTTRRLAVLDEIAGELGATRNQVVLAWLTGGRPQITPIVGVSTLEQLEEAIAGVAFTLSEEQRGRLNAAS